METDIEKLKKQQEYLLDSLKRMVRRYGSNQNCPDVEYARIIIREVEAAK